MIAIVLVSVGAGFAQKPANEAPERAAIQAVLDAHGATWTRETSYMAGLHDENGKEVPPQVSSYTGVLVQEHSGWKVTAFRSLPQVKPQTAAQ